MMAVHAVQEARYMHDPKASYPRVWLLLGDKLGDNGQVDNVVQALGWPCERKHIQPLEAYVFAKPDFKASLFHVDLDRSDPLEPPWPDLIITIGRRPSMAALWVREQSGGYTKVVLIGKPSGLVDDFALIATSAENLLPRWPNVLPLSLPLMQPDEAAIARASVAWRSRLAPLPRPLVALLVGGPTRPVVFDAAEASKLARAAAASVVERGGTLYVTTSRRTPAEVIDAIEAEMPSGAPLYRWSAEADENPYLGLLGLADNFIVTGDSISMMVEVARLGKPLAIYSFPPRKRGLISGFRRELDRRLLTIHQHARYGRIVRGAIDKLFRSGAIHQMRDIGAFQQILIDRGIAVPLGEPFKHGSYSLPDEVTAVVDRIKLLMEKR